MAETDRDEIGGGQRAGRHWTFEGFLTGVKQAFGLGGSNVITASANQASSNGALPDGDNLALKMARHAQRDQGFRNKFFTRMTYSEAKLRMWKNIFLEDLDRKLLENFHPENWRRMRLMRHTSTNMLQRVVHELSITYESPPRRFFEEDQKKDPPEDKKEAKAVPPVPPQPPPVPGQPPVPPVIPNKATPPPGNGVLQTGIAQVDALADKLSLEGADSPAESDILQKLTKHSNLDAVMEAVEMFSRFLPCVWVRPMVRYDQVIETTVETVDEATGQTTSATKQDEDPKSGCLEYLIYTPDIADVVPDPDNPTKMMAWWYYSTQLNVQGEMQKFVNFWTDDNYIKLDDEWRIITVESNPYGVIPVAEVRLGVPSNEYYLDGQGDDIYEGSMELCVLKTIQNARARDAGFKQIVMTGTDEKSTPSDQVMGGPTPLYTGDGGSATVLDLQPQLKEWTDMCKERGQELAAKYGISNAEFVGDKTPQSGFAKQLDMAKIVAANRRSRKFFVKAEVDLYAKTRAVMEARPVPAIGVLPDKPLEIDFAEPMFTEDPVKQTVIDAQRIKLNLDSIIDVMKRENPDLSEVELLELAAKKKQINDAFIPKVASSLLDLLATGGTRGTNPQAAEELGAPVVAAPGGGGGNGPPGR